MQSPQNGTNQSAEHQEIIYNYEDDESETPEEIAIFKNDPSVVNDHVLEILSYLRYLETRYPVRRAFLRGHELSPTIRSYIIDWLVAVHKGFGLCLDTLHLCVSNMDRYLQQNRKAGRKTIKLVGMSALVVAMKYLKMCVPDLKDFVSRYNFPFSVREILVMEQDILRTLDFNLGRPVSVQFLAWYNKAAQVQGDHQILGEFLLELALMDYNLSHVEPSRQAAAACCLSMGILGDVMELRELWTPTLVHYSKYEYLDFEDVVDGMALVIYRSESAKLQRIRRKYASPIYAEISMNTRLNGPLVQELTYRE